MKTTVNLPAPCPTCGAPTTRVLERPHREIAYKSRNYSDNNSAAVVEAVDALAKRMEEGFALLSQQLRELTEAVDASGASVGGSDRLADTIAAVAMGKTPPGERWRDQER